MKNIKKTKEFPTYLAKIRTDLIIQVNKLGLSMQNISDIFSVGITRTGVHQITSKDKKDEHGIK